MKHVCFAIAAAVLAVTVHAGWTWDMANGTLTDGNWTFNTAKKVVTQDGVNGIQISDNTFTHADSGNTVIDFTGGAVEKASGVTYPVVSANINFYGTAMNATKFIAPDVTAIGALFQRNTYIEEVELSPNITSLGSERAFETCTALRKFSPEVMPNVTTIPKNLFNGAKMLEGDFEFPNATVVKDTPFNNCAKITSVRIPKVVNISNIFGTGMTSLRSVEISPDITSLSGTFNGCSALETLEPREFPKVTSIGASTFYLCGKLTGALSLPEVTTIGEGSFRQCGLNEIDLPKLTQTGKNAFIDSPNLAKVTVGGLGATLPAGQFKKVNANGGNEFDLYWIGADLPTTFSDSWLRPDGGSKRARLHCRGAALQAWLDLLTSKYTSPSYTLRLAADFTNTKYKDDEKADYPGEKAKAIVIDGLSYGEFWLCEWEQTDPMYDMMVSCPEHVRVTKLVADGELILPSDDGSYRVAQTAKITIDYQTEDGWFFADGTTVYTVADVPAAESLPATICDKEVIAASECGLTVDLAALAEKHIDSVVLSSDSEFTCETNGTVITWTLVSGCPFVLEYTANPDYRFPEGARTLTVEYASGISADTPVDVGALPVLEKFVSVWSWDVAAGTCTDGNWKFTCTKYANGKWTSRSTVDDVTGICLTGCTEGEGNLDLTSFKTDTAAQAAAAGVENYDVIEFSLSLFYRNNGVINVKAPAVLKLGSSAFREAKSLVSAEFSPDIFYIGDRQFLNASAFTTFKPANMPKLTSIGDKNPSAFNGTLVTGDFYLGKVTYISSSAFVGTKVTSVVAPEATYIDNQAFYRCALLTNAVLPKVSSFGANCLDSCFALSNLVITGSVVTNIDTSAFGGIPARTFPTKYPQLQIVKNQAFSGAGIAGDVEMPLVPILDRAFSGCSNLTSLTATNCTCFGYYAFSDCISLTNLTVKGSADCFPTTMPYSQKGANNALAGCTKLTDVYWLGEEAPTRLDSFSLGNGDLVGPGVRLLCVHVMNRAARTDWEKVCTVLSADFTDDYKLIANWKENRKRIWGYIGGTIKVNKTKDDIERIYATNNNLCWIIDGTWQPDGLIITIK